LFSSLQFPTLFFPAAILDSQQSSETAAAENFQTFLVCFYYNKIFVIGAICFKRRRKREQNTGQNEHKITSFMCHSNFEHKPQVHDVGSAMAPCQPACRHGVSIDYTRPFTNNVIIIFKPSENKVSVNVKRRVNE